MPSNVFANCVDSFPLSQSTFTRDCENSRISPFSDPCRAGLGRAGSYFKNRNKEKKLIRKRKEKIDISMNIYLMGIGHYFSF